MEEEEFVIWSSKKMNNLKRKAPVDNSEKNVERLQKKALAEEERRKKPGECLKVESVQYFL